MAETPVYTPEEYTESFIDFGRPFKVDFGATTPTNTSLSEDSGISNIIEPEKLDTNPAINKLIDPMHDSSNDLKVFTLGDTFDITSDIASFDSMLKTAGYDDTSTNSPFNAKNAAAKGVANMILPAFGALGVGGGKLGFGANLTGPTGKQVFSVGKLSEGELKRHYDNFAKVQQAYGGGISNTGDAPFAGKIDHRNMSTGFAMTVGNFHFSRDPSKMRYDGHKGHLSSEDHNAHMMLKSMEALSKGLDPRGYRLDGQGMEDVNSLVVSVPKGMGGVTDDGYFTSVANNGYGYTKSALGGGNLSAQLATSLGVSTDDLMTAMEMARKDKNMTVSLALQQLGATSSSTVSINIVSNQSDSENTDALGNKTNLKSMSAVGNVDPFGRGDVKYAYGTGVVDPSQLGREMSMARPYTGMSRFVDTTTNTVRESSSNFTTGNFNRVVPAGSFNSTANLKASQDNQDARREEAMANRAAQKQVEEDEFAGFGTDYFNKGGQVTQEMQEGGQAQLVGGVMPQQVSEQATVADDQPRQVADDSFVLNAPSVEEVVLNPDAINVAGVQDIRKMILDAYTFAKSKGMSIANADRGLYEEAVDVALSKGELVIPPDLVKVIGLDRLKKINNRGKKEVSERAKESSPQQLQRGGEVALDLNRNMNQGFIQ